MIANPLTHSAGPSRLYAVCAESQPLPACAEWEHEWNGHSSGTWKCARCGAVLLSEVISETIVQAPTKYDASDC